MCGSKPILLCIVVVVQYYQLCMCCRRAAYTAQRRQSKSIVSVPPAHFPFERLTPGRCLGVAARCGARCTPGGPDSRPGGPVVAPRSVVAYAFGAYICERQWPCLAQRFAPGFVLHPLRLVTSRGAGPPVDVGYRLVRRLPGQHTVTVTWLRLL